LNIRDLKYLVAVHDLNNFSKAAERCFVSQPTLSGQLKKLEEELGAVLIERSTRQVLFTPLGNQIVTMAREILLSVDNIVNAAHASDDPFSGEFHIGLIPTVGPFLLPILMPVLTQEFPNVKLFLYELKTDELIERLLKGELDAAILAKLNWRHPVSETHLYQEPMKLAVKEGSELSKQRSAVSLSSLDNQSVLMLEDGHCLRDQALDVCFSAGAVEDERFKATSMDTLLHMVSAGAGMTLIPKLACVNRVSGVTYVSFDEPQPKREIVMLTRKNSTRKLVLDAFANCIQRIYSQFEKSSEPSSVS
jgi:LysR family hydrogen peroxide-inducible transcriptional activator